MSKVGIMSMQRVVNYGSFLQAFALKGLLEEMGHTVEFVDYKVAEDNLLTNQARGNNSSKEKLKLIFADSIGMLFRNNTKIRRICNAIQCTDLFQHRFEHEFIPMLGVTSERNERAEVDTLIIGSDEVFNIMHNSMELFGLDNRAKRLISFAASFGNTDFSHIVDADMCTILKERLHKFDALSVRDRNSIEIVERLSDGTIHPQYHLDPVLHYDYSAYIPQIKYRRKYIAVYAYSNIPNQLKRAIERFAKSLGLDILCLQGYQGDMGHFMNVNPFEMLAYIKNAEYLVTTTFHGCVFGAKYSKKMAIYIVTKDNKSYNNESKLGDLTKRLGLSDSVFTNENNFEKALMHEINYTELQDLINRETEQGRRFLEENVK